MACPLSSPCATCVIVSIGSSSVCPCPKQSSPHSGACASPNAGGRLSPRRSPGRRDRSWRSGLVPGIFLLRRLEPRRKFALLHDPHRDRHEGVILAAQLGALAVKRALDRRLE